MLRKGLSHLRLLTIAILAAGPAQADTTVLTVDSSAQQFSAGDLPTNCTLGDALDAANADAAVDGCVHPNLGTGGPFELEMLPGTGPFVLAGSRPARLGRVGLPVVRADVTLRANGNTIERNPAFACPDPVGGEFRLFEIDPGARLVLEDVGLHNGCAPSSGAIHNLGQLVLRRSLVSNNEATSGDGGAIGNQGGNAEIVESTIGDNQASDEGGAITNARGSVLVVRRSTLARNGARVGGGIQNIGSDATLLNSTVSTNTATEGGGIANGGGASLTLLNATIAGNTASQGRGLYNFDGTMTFANSILADRCFFLRSPGAADAGNNVERWNGCGLTAASSIVNVSTGITGLADNGGPTPTHGIVMGSPAVGAGDMATCLLAGVDGMDQRGVGRPDGDPAGGGSCDVGAFEFADCDASGVDDGSEMAADASLDADGDGVLDVCADDPPLAVAGPDQTLECSSASGALATLDGSGSVDPEGAPLTYAWSGVFGDASGVTADVDMPLGSSMVDLAVADPAGNTGSDSLTVTVTDSGAPAASAGVERVAMNGDWDDVRIQASCSDACDPGVLMEAIFDGVTVADGDVVQVLGFEDASAAPMLTVTCSDASGNGAEATAAAPARDPVVVEPPDDRRDRWKKHWQRWKKRARDHWDRIRDGIRSMVGRMLRSWGSR
jgi:hypothetical protein